MNEVTCKACAGTGCLTDENGCQHDDVCPECMGLGTVEVE